MILLYETYDACYPQTKSEGYSFGVVRACLQMTTNVLITGIFDTLVAKTSYASSHIRSYLKLHKSTKGGNPCKF